MFLPALFDLTLLRFSCRLEKGFILLLTKNNRKNLNKEKRKSLQVRLNELALSLTEGFPTFRRLDCNVFRHFSKGVFRKTFTYFGAKTVVLPSVSN